MKKYIGRLNWDFIGFSASTLCAIHCLALPFLMTFSAMSGFQFLESPILEYSMLILAILIAIRSLLPSYQQHKRPHAVFVFALSLILVILSRFFPEESMQELLFTVMGGFGFAFAHYLNWRALSSMKRTFEENRSPFTKPSKPIPTQAIYSTESE